MRTQSTKQFDRLRLGVPVDQKPQWPLECHRFGFHKGAKNISPGPDDQTRCMLNTNHTRLAKGHRARFPCDPLASH